MDHNKLRIAVVGAGISGLTVARLLSTSHSITVFEAADQLGGHAQTLTVESESGGPMQVDAGVCMFYSTGYPNFFRLLKSLGIQIERSPAHVELCSIPSDKRYFLDLNHPWKSLFYSLCSTDQRWMAKDGVRFYQSARRAMRNPTDFSESLGEHLNNHNYSEPFRVLISFMAGATWTINQKGLAAMPLAFVAKTMWELGFLPRFDHGHWYHIKGSVARYIHALACPIADRVLRSNRVELVERVENKVLVRTKGQEQEFDHVIFAIPPNVALHLIANPCDEEIGVLSTFRGTEHSVSFTSDDSIVRHWTNGRPVMFAASDVTNRNEEANREFLFRVGFANIKAMCNYPIVDSLYMWYNFPGAASPSRLLGQVVFSTPTFSKDILLAQRRHADVSGRDRLHFCGASWTNGIHEGGVVSALNVGRHFGKGLEDIEKV